MTLVAARDPARSDGAGWPLVLGIVLASLTEAIASTVLSLGRADIIGDTYATPDELAWLDVGYTGLKLVGFALAPWLLTRGRAWNILFAATLVMGAACGAAAITASLDALIVLRAVQGLAGGILLVSGQAILFWTYPASRQPILQAIFATGAVVAPATLVPYLQGWLLDEHSWVWIFFSVVPLSLAAAGLLMMVDPVRSPLVERRPLDGIGLGLLSVALLSATYVLSQGSRWDWFEASHIVWSSLIAVAALLLYAWRERVSPSPLLDTAVFRVDDFTFAFIVSFVAGAALFGSAFLIPSFAVSVLGFTPTAAGQLLLPSGGLFVASLFLAALLMRNNRLPPIATVPFGILFFMAAMWMLSGSNAASGASDMSPAVLLRGLGLGFLFLSITLIAFMRLPPTGIAFGIGLFNIGRQLGGLIGVAGLQTVLDHHAAASRTVLGAAINQGSPALAERISTLSSFLVGRGMEAGAAAKAATSQLGRAIAEQAVVIAFDTAFMLLALFFVAAAPILLTAKVLLARAGRRRPAPA